MTITEIVERAIKARGEGDGYYDGMDLVEVIGFAVARAVVEECAKIAEMPEPLGEQIRLGRTTAQMIRALAVPDPSGGKGGQ